MLGSWRLRLGTCTRNWAGCCPTLSAERSRHARARGLRTDALLLVARPGRIAKRGHGRLVGPRPHAAPHPRRGTSPRQVATGRLGWTSGLARDQRAAAGGRRQMAARRSEIEPDVRGSTVGDERRSGLCRERRLRREAGRLLRPRTKPNQRLRARNVLSTSSVGAAHRVRYASTKGSQLFHLFNSF